MSNPAGPIDTGQVPNTPATSRDIAVLANELLGALSPNPYPWWYPQGAYGLQVDPFVYVAEFLPLAAASTQNVQFAIGGDAAFLLRTTKLVETDTGNTVFLPQHPILVQLTDSGSGRNLASAAVHVDNWFGTAQLPDSWEMIKVFAPNATITVQAQNLENTDRNVRIAFCGWKIFSYTPNVQ